MDPDQKSSTSGTTIFSYDGDTVEVSSGGTAVARYAQGLGIDEPLAIYRSGVASYYHADGLGSIVALTNSTGFPTAAYLYDSFSNLVASAGNVVNPFRYTAREFDAETGLYYYRARHYDATTGRLLSEDPIRWGGGQKSFYPYVGNSPANYVDPFGLRIVVQGSMSDYEQAVAFGGTQEWPRSLPTLKGPQRLIR